MMSCNIKVCINFISMVFPNYTPSKLVLPDYLFYKLFVGILLLTISMSQIFHVTFYMSFAILPLWISCSYFSFIFILDCSTFHWRILVFLIAQWLPMLCLLQVLPYWFEENFVSLYAWFKNIFYYGNTWFYFLTFLLVLFFFKYVSII